MYPDSSSSTFGVPAEVSRQAHTSLQMAVGIFVCLTKYVSSYPPKIEDELSGYTTELKTRCNCTTLERLNLSLFLGQPDATEDARKNVRVVVSPLSSGWNNILGIVLDRTADRHGWATSEWLLKLSEDNNSTHVQTSLFSRAEG